MLDTVGGLCLKYGISLSDIVKLPKSRTAEQQIRYYVLHAVWLNHSRLSHASKVAVSPIDPLMVSPDFVSRMPCKAQARYIYIH